MSAHDFAIDPPLLRVASQNGPNIVLSDRKVMLHMMPKAVSLPHQEASLLELIA